MIVSYLRTLLLYLLLIASVRLMGKRQIGQMEASEFVVTMLVANLAAIPMQDGAIPLYAGALPILTILGAELVLAGLMLRLPGLRRLLCGQPVILVKDGKILEKNLRMTRVTLEELMGHLRKKDVLALETVQYAILETDGNLSVFPYPKEKPATAKDAGIQAGRQELPTLLIRDGQLSRQALEKAGRDLKWLEETLCKHRASREQTLLLTVTPSGQVFWQGKEPV